MRMRTKTAFTATDSGPPLDQNTQIRPRGQSLVGRRSRILVGPAVREHWRPEQPLLRRSPWNGLTAKYGVANVSQNSLAGGPPVFVSVLSLRKQMTSINNRWH